MEGLDGEWRGGGSMMIGGGEGRLRMEWGDRGGDHDPGDLVHQGGGGGTWQGRRGGHSGRRRVVTRF